MKLVMFLLCEFLQNVVLEKSSAVETTFTGTFDKSLYVCLWTGISVSHYSNFTFSTPFPFILILPTKDVRRKGHEDQGAEATGVLTI